MTMFETENTALWMPAGRPMRRMRPSVGQSMPSAFGSRWMTCVLRRRRMYSSTELTVLEMTVAMATPLTFMCSTATKNRLSRTFRTPELASAINGIFVSPTLRKIAASKL